ncbi:hypothetical protein [Pseudoalteromonas sp. SG44-17]|uniref:hypothetical protein n=1 Tax=Pseudoalteromonas sp. SG44-17 TaxID=2760963 RepID=UPI0015FF61F8|nr:hypothetical protein [Pseudoalteromonas sp. SG44-17]MBB1411217.1 hypothetical protein [Pseudoalteromonas sp. SG44-17]
MALIKPIYPVPLINKIKALLAFKLPSSEMPPPPITYVDDNVCKLSNNSIKARNMGIIPMLFMVSFIAFYQVVGFYSMWKSTEESMMKMVDFYKKKYGEDYFLSPNVEPVSKSFYDMFDENGKMSLSRYMHYHYYETADVGGTFRLKRDIILSIFIILTLPPLLYFLIFFKRQAPMVFDRNRQIVYHWYKGNVRAQHFKDLRIHEDSQMMRIQTRSLGKRGDMRWANFMVQPRHNPYYNGKDAYAPVLAFICQFMEYGREHVMPQHEQWQSDDKPFAFFDDEKPKDFEQQLNAVLTHLSENDTDIPLDKDNLPLSTGMDMSMSMRLSRAESRESNKAVDKNE